MATEAGPIYSGSWVSSGGLASHLPQRRDEASSTSPFPGLSFLQLHQRRGWTCVSRLTGCAHFHQGWCTLVQKVSRCHTCVCPAGRREEGSHHHDPFDVYLTSMGSSVSRPAGRRQHWALFRPCCPPWHPTPCVGRSARPLSRQSQNEAPGTQPGSHSHSLPWKNPTSRNGKKVSHSSPVCVWGVGQGSSCKSEEQKAADPQSQDPSRPRPRWQRASCGRG